MEGLVSMDNDELIALLELGITKAVELLVERVADGKASASDISQLRGLFADAGGSLTFNGRPNPVGDEVLESLKDIDPDLLN